MNKTPVTILQELMQKWDCTPEYELLPSEGVGTHLPTFYYRATAKNVTKIGKARSKKDAKHTAAKLVLEEFTNMGLYHPEHYPKTTSCSPITTSPANLSINAIGPLKEFCSEKNIPQPEFILISDIGPAHQRHFTMECRIGTMPGICGSDLTKKKAKQQAAQKMLHRLMDCLPDEIEEYISQNTKELSLQDTVLDYYNENSLINKKKINWGLKIYDYPKSIKDIMAKKNLSNEELWKDITEKTEESLRNLLNKLELNMFMETCDLEDNKIMIFISIDSEPEFAVYGFGDTRSEATDQAISSLFNFLEVMSK